ncbi:MAG TPA: hypothetical protein PKD20_05415 [Candidatus Saccharibacteria bacterium]|nr:hypothetical protein [Candidatus Saccharibacteria bacterium]
MFKRLLSHLLIGLATFTLTATFFMWTIDARLLEPTVLNGELQKAGVFEEFTKLLPQIVTTDEEATEQEKQDMVDKISQSIDAAYVQDKLLEISSSLTTFMKSGEPDPVLDISDFPDRLSMHGVEAGEEIESKFNDPIELNKDGNLDMVPKVYKTFSMVKWAGVFVFVGLLLLEWLLVEKGKKLRRISRIFLYAGISYFLYWVLLVGAQSKLGPVLQKNVQATYDTTGLITAILKAINGIFSAYFLSFALACFAVTVTLYAIRHYRDGDVLKAQPENTGKKNPKKA